MKRENIFLICIYLIFITQICFEACIILIKYFFIKFKKKEKNKKAVHRISTLPDNYLLLIIISFLIV